MALHIFKDTRSPSLTGTLTVDGVAFDLTSSTVKFKMRPAGSATLTVDAAAVIVTAASGSVRYDWLPADVDVAGDFIGWWEVTLPSGKTQDHPEFLIVILEHAQPAGNLCEVLDVRRQSESPSITTTPDDLIEVFITSASDAIANRCQREFAAVTGTPTRTFRVDNSLVDLAPYDLRAATTVTLHPEGTAQVLVANTDYSLAPIGGALGGTYQMMRLSRNLNACSTFADSFGYAQLSVIGTWGMAAIPDDVNRATALTVSSWLDRGIAEYGIQGLEDGGSLRPDRFFGWPIPAAAHHLLAPYDRKLTAY